MAQFDPFANVRNALADRSNVLMAIEDINRRREQDAIKNRMAGFEMERAQQQMGAQNALAQGLPDFLKPSAIPGQVGRMPSQAEGIQDAAAFIGDISRQYPQAGVGVQDLAQFATMQGLTAPKPGKQIERTVDLGDKVEYIYTSGERETKPKAASPNAIVIGGSRTAKEERDLRKEFQALPEVKTFVEIDSQVKRLEKAMEENQRGGSKVAVDQALITILNKMLDPSSVVRESEYARTPGDLAFLNRMRGKLEKLKTGGAGLTDEDRTAIANMARNFSAVAQDMYNAQEAYYNDLANRYGYAPENIVRLGGPAARGRAPQPPAPKPGAAPQSGGIQFVGWE